MACPLAARAQQAGRTYRLGVLHNRGPQAPPFPPFYDELRRAIRQPFPSSMPRCRRSEVQFKWQRLRKSVFEDVKNAMEAAGLSRDRSESLLEIRHGVLCRRFDLGLYWLRDRSPGGRNQLTDDAEGCETLIKLGGRVVMERVWIGQCEDVQIDDARRAAHLKDQVNTGPYNRPKVAVGLLQGKIVRIKERVERIRGRRVGGGGVAVPPKVLAVYAGPP
jgi:hypothetical protein